MERLIRTASVGVLVLLLLSNFSGGWILAPSAGPIRVLVVTETSQMADYGWLNTSTEWRAYANEYAEKHKGEPMVRVFDQHTELVSEHEWFAELLKRERQSVPWLYIGRGERLVVDAPLGNEADMLDTLKKWGG